LCRLPPAKVLFQSNPYELAAGPDTCFVKQLLEEIDILPVSRPTRTPGWLPC